MIKRIWKLYKEVRRLRNKVKTLEEGYTQANYAREVALQEAAQWRQYIRDAPVQMPYDSIHVVVPNMYGFEAIMNHGDIDHRPRAEFLMKRMTNEAKIHIMDDLMNQGYFRKIRDDKFTEIYEIKVVR